MEELVAYREHLSKNSEFDEYLPIVDKCIEEMMEW